MCQFSSGCSLRAIAPKVEISPDLEISNGGPSPDGHRRTYSGARPLLLRA